jgi:pyruvate oxidase
MGAAGAVLDLAKKIRAPVVTTFRAKGILPDENEWVAGYTGHSGHRMPARSSASRTS